MTTHRRRYSRRRTGPASSSRKFLWLAIAALAIGAVSSLAAMSLYNTTTPLDETTLCRTDVPPAEAMVVVIDATDTLPARAAAKSRAIINKRVHNAPANTLIQVYQVLPDDKHHLQPLVSVCKPDNGDSANAFIASPALMQQRFEEHFAKPLDDAINTLLVAEPSSASPLIEAIDSAVIEAFLPLDESTPKRLLLVSDLLQHSPLMSFYATTPSSEALRASVAARGHSALDFRGARIELLVIPRDIPKGSRKDLIEFWSQLLVASNAGLGSSMEPL